MKQEERILAKIREIKKLAEAVYKLNNDSPSEVNKHSEQSFRSENNLAC